jgi:DNA-binding transcriptional ArsR family regulator
MGEAKLSTVEAAETASDKAIARLAIALGHPLRARILASLARGPSSATKLARQYGGVTNGDIFYHLGVLNKLDVIELERSRKVRGATESLFRLQPRANWAKLWQAIPFPALDGWRSMVLRQFVELAVSALDAGSLDEQDTQFAAAPVTLDRRGFSEVSLAIQTALEIVDRAEIESRARLANCEADTEINAVVAAAVFRAPQVADAIPLDAQIMD